MVHDLDNAWVKNSDNSWCVSSTGGINQFNLTELEKRILAHIYKYGPDTPWLLARRLLGAAGWRPIVPEDEVEKACEHLVQLGLLQEFRGSLKGRVTSSVKPWLKVKQRNPERRGRGVYYDLTRLGRRVAGYIWKNEIRDQLRRKD